MIKTTLRAKRQITLPKAVVMQLNLRQGDVLIVAVEHDRATLRPVRGTYRGALKDEFKSGGDIATFLRSEREPWRA